MTPPPPGSWSRWAVIRGDALTIAVVTVLAGVALVALVGMGRLAPIGLVGALGLVLAGGWGVAWSRRAWRALLAEVAARYGGLDAGPSPVAWVSDRAWRAANRFDPGLDGPLVLLAEVDRELVVFPKDARGAFVRPHLRPVSAEERDLTPTDLGAVDGPVPEAGDADTITERLRGTPGRQIAVEPLWPVCCGRPTTLLSVRPDLRPQGARWLPAGGALASGEEADFRGLHTWRCRACGRAYATDPVW